MLADKVERWVKEWKEAGLEEGRREGRALGLEEGHAEGRAEGHAEGHAEGRAEGHAEGQAKGLILGRAQALLDLARAGTISVQQAESAIDAIIAESPGLTAELQSLKDSLQGH
jgi:flagellar biosynthesis/type III secretory pathway protein FliH